jgi:lysozyme family protein
MTLTAELRSELTRSINTLRRRILNTSDEAEKKALRKALEALNDKQSILNQAQLLQAADVLVDATAILESAIASARLGPFDGYLAAIEQHLRNLDVLSAEMHSREALSPAPESGGAADVTTEGAVAPRKRARTTRGARALPPGIGAVTTSKKFADLASEYQAWYDACELRREHRANLDYYLKRLERGRPSYEDVARELRMPWVFIGTIHGMECGFNFSAHLHNGDPLTARTTQVPANRPAAGNPPFTWRESAIDALTLKKLHEVTDWSIPRMLYLLEQYNGFGYRMRGVPTPYLWSFSNLYEKGKFVADGRYDPNAVSKQCGAALIVKALMGAQPRARSARAGQARSRKAPARRSRSARVR